MLPGLAKTIISQLRGRFIPSPSRPSFRRLEEAKTFFGSDGYQIKIGEDGVRTISQFKPCSPSHPDGPQMLIRAWEEGPKGFIRDIYPVKDFSPPHP